MKKLHLGCGSVIYPDWINLDMDPPRGGVKCNLAQGVPGLDNSVDYIFHEHFIEHLTRDEGVRLFRDCYRVLKPGGVMRFSTPDLWMIVGWYQKGKLDVWKDVWEPGTPCQLLNGAMRNWDHKFLYDQMELSDLLAEVGFTDNTAEIYRKSDHESLCNLETRPYFQEIIIEATK